MRLNSPLYKFNVHRMFKDHWKLQGSRRIIEQPVPNELSQKGIEILDAKLVARPKVDLPKVPIPEPYKPPQPLDWSHPLWKQRICHICKTSTQLLEGLPQVQVLTKTIVYDGLPEQVQQLVGVVDQQDQDDLVKRCILLSNVFDGYQERLPVEKCPDPPHKDLPREYGIPVKRRLELLLRNLVRLMESQTGKYQVAIQRLVSRDSPAIIMAEKDNDILKFHVNSDIMITTEKPLAPFASKKQIDKAKTIPLPDIFPIKSTMDLEQTNIYNTSDFYPFVKASNYPYAHSLYLCDAEPETRWSKSCRKARALFTCYAFAAAQAKCIYGDIENLPEPITIQCIISNGAEFDLLAFQLNTLNLNTDGSTKNVAWLESDMKLYDHCFQFYGKLYFEGYNPEVYRQLLAMHVYGLDLTEPLSINKLLPTKITEQDVTQSTQQLNH